jgi:hypothetical protein
MSEMELICHSAMVIEGNGHEMNRVGGSGRWSFVRAPPSLLSILKLSKPLSPCKAQCPAVALELHRSVNVPKAHSLAPPGHPLE